MALVKCKECGKEISKSAKQCTNCGHDNRNWFGRRNIISKAFIVFFGLIFLMGVLGGLLGGDDSSTSSSASSSFSEKTQDEISTMSVEEIKNKSSRISYDDLMRYNERYVGNIIYYRGQIVQFSENPRGKDILRLATKKLEYSEDYYENVIYVNYKGPRLLEGDIIDLWGEVKGLKTYPAVLGNSVTIPEINALRVELVTKAEKNN